MSGFGYLLGSVQKFAALYHRKSGITESVKAVVGGRVRLDNLFDELRIDAELNRTGRDS